MSEIQLTKTIEKQISKTVEFYMPKRRQFVHFAETVLGDFLENESFEELIHYTKIRAKDPDHLRDKLERKAKEAIEDGEKFTITPDNLFIEIEDLAGVRLLHLHTQQMKEIHPLIIEMFEEHNYELVPKPVAYTWDDEYSQFFESIGIEVSAKDSMYTSVHYIIKSNSRTEMRCEIQVRTLVEEVWGEVSHKINYPHETESQACQEQLRVLARATSTCTRLVDSIFVSNNEYKELTTP